ncbi:hypothetical protein ABIA30_005517 [Mycobacterium sp. MAA66]|uniref:hypothetical protein n=1 Tax=Mycobacterium sp. MAA66 TaxID=3156297 RepID=UPI00351573C8
MTMMRAFTVFSSLCSAVAAAMLGVAVSAHADGDNPDIPLGVYSYQQDGLPAGQWSFYPICAQTVGDLRVNLELPVGCTVHVASNDLTIVATGDARLSSGLWTFTQPNPTGFTCPDGQTMPITETYAIDWAAKSGTRTVTHNTQCGVDANMVKSHFTIAYKGPLSMPVDQYPMYCSPYDALRRCS